MALLQKGHKLCVVGNQSCWVFQKGRCVCQLEIWVVMVSKEPSALDPSESVSQLTSKLSTKHQHDQRNPQTHMSNNLDK